MGWRRVFFGVSLFLTSQDLSSFLFSEIIEINQTKIPKKSTMFSEIMEINETKIPKNSTMYPYLKPKRLLKKSINFQKKSIKIQ